MRVRVGFIPLVDSAGLVLAEAMGFARAEGLELALTREASWATLRDKLAVGAIDAAHLLAPMPVASRLALGNPKPPFAALMGLSMNGNAISVTASLFDAMREAGPPFGPHDIMAKAKALAGVIAHRAAAGRPRLTFAVVHPFSPHNFELRYVLGAAGIDPDGDVDLVVVPPPFVVDHLRKGLIDGFCVGAPWTHVGLAEGLTRVIATKSQIWRLGPEKVLGMCEADVSARPELAMKLVRAAKAALAWVDDPANHAEAARILSRPEVLDLDARIIVQALSGDVPLDDAPSRTMADFLVFDREGSTVPRRSHALWFYSQMVRWGYTAHSPALEQRAAQAYRPDLYREALAGRAVPQSPVDGRDHSRVGTVPAPGPASGDVFFDGRPFDARDVSGYVDGFEVRARLRNAS